MLGESNLNNLPQTEFGAGLTDSSIERSQDPRDVLKEARENVIKVRENQAVAFKDSIQAFISESLEKNLKNEQIIATFRKKSPDEQNELLFKYHTKVDELEQKNSELKRKLDEYKVEGKGKWISFKYEFNHDMMLLDKALKDINPEA